MKKADVITGIVLLILASGVISGAWQMPQSATFGPGAGFLPLWIGVILAILAMILLISAWTRQPTGKDAVSPFPGRKPLLSIIGVLGGLAVYILLIEILGFLVDTFLYVTFLLGVVEHERWQRTVSVALFTTVGLYVVFQVLLTISLPKNIFGF
jgi:putative tricarboxylic transport membrane protein